MKPAPATLSDDTKLASDQPVPAVLRYQPLVAWAGCERAARAVMAVSRVKRVARMRGSGGGKCEPAYPSLNSDAVRIIL